MLLLRISSSLTALSRIFLDVSSTIRHFHYLVESSVLQLRASHRVLWGAAYVALGNVLDLLDNDWQGKVSYAGSRRDGDDARVPSCCSWITDSPMMVAGEAARPASVELLRVGGRMRVRGEVVGREQRREARYSRCKIRAGASEMVQLGAARSTTGRGGGGVVTDRQGGFGGVAGGGCWNLRNLRTLEAAGDGHLPLIGPLATGGPRPADALRRSFVWPWWGIACQGAAEEPWNPSRRPCSVRRSSLSAADSVPCTSNAMRSSRHPWTELRLCCTRGLRIAANLRPTQKAIHHC